MCGEVIASSKIRHNNVIAVEIDKGGGVEGGDAIIVSIRQVQYDLDTLSTRVNRYRLAQRLISLSIDVPIQYKIEEVDDKVRIIFEKALDVQLILNYTSEGATLMIKSLGEKI